MARNPKLKVEIGADTTGLKGALGEAKSLVGGFKSALGGLAAATGGIIAVGSAFRGIVSSVQAANVQLQAVAAIESRLRSMGNAAGFTSLQLQKMASDLQANSLFGDEEILTSVTQQLLTFGNVSGDVFRRAQQSALDLSTVLGTGLQGSAIMLGKALNDPVQGLTALRRAGVAFSEAQQNTIKRMVETNRVAEAQVIILAEVERQFGGAANAAARAGTGPITQLKNTIGDLKEELGKGLIPALGEAATALNRELVKPETIESFRTLGEMLGGIVKVLAGAVEGFRTLQDLWARFTISGQQAAAMRQARMAARTVDDVRGNIEAMMRGGYTDTSAPAAPVVARESPTSTAAAQVSNAVTQLREQLASLNRDLAAVQEIGVEGFRALTRQVQEAEEAMRVAREGIALKPIGKDIDATINKFSLDKIGLPTAIVGFEHLRNVVVDSTVELNRMRLAIDEMGTVFAQGFVDALTASLGTIANIGLGIDTIGANMRALGDTLRRLVAQLAVAVARAAALAALTTALSPLAGSAFGKSTFGAAFFRGLGIGGGGAASNFAVGEIRLRGSDIIASITAQQRIDRALS
jgi:hypothetical protein